MEGNTHTYPQTHMQSGNVTTRDENGSTLVEMLNRIDALDSIPQLQVNQSSSVESVRTEPNLEISSMEVSTTVQDVPPSAHGLQAIEHGLQPTAHGLQATEHGLQPTAHGLQPTEHGLQPTVHGLQATEHGLQPTVHGLQPTAHGLQPTVQPTVQPHGVTIQPTAHDVHVQTPTGLQRTAQGVQPATHDVSSIAQGISLTEGLSGMEMEGAANLIVQLPTEVSSEISIPSKNKVGRPRTRPPKQHHEWHYHLGGVRHCRVPLAPELREVLEVAYVSKILSNNLRKEGQPEKERIARITGMDLDKIQEWFKNRRKKDRLQRDKFPSPRQRKYRKSTEGGSVSGTDQSLSSTTEHALEDIAMETIAIGQKQ